MAGAPLTHHRRPRHPHGGVADLFPASALFLSSEYHHAQRLRASVPLAGVAVRKRRGHRSCSSEWRSAYPPSPFAPEGKPSSRQWQKGGAPPLPVFFVQCLGLPMRTRLRGTARHKAAHFAGDLEVRIGEFFFLFSSVIFGFGDRVLWGV
jgi:hypothetical protein